MKIKSLRFIVLLTILAGSYSTTLAASEVIEVCNYVKKYTEQINDQVPIEDGPFAKISSMSSFYAMDKCYIVFKYSIDIDNFINFTSKITNTNEFELKKYIEKNPKYIKDVLSIHFKEKITGNEKFLVLKNAGVNISLDIHFVENKIQDFTIKL